MRYTAVPAAVLLAALTACGSTTAARPTAVPSPTGTAACEQALADVYQKHLGGEDTGSLPKPAACVGIPNAEYIQLGFLAMAGASPTAP